MEKGSGCTWLAMLSSLTAAGVAAAVTFFATMMFALPNCDSPLATVDVPINRPDYTERMYDPIKDVTAIRAYAAQKCFLLSGRRDDSTPRAFHILGTKLDEHLTETIYGRNIADFCRDMTAYPIEPVQSGRHKRQSETTTSVGRPANACQNNVVVDCGEGSDTAVYQCNTGPAEVYGAEITCVEANQFRFTLVRRCDQFAETKGLRWMKCLQKFLLGKTGEPIGSS